MTSTRLGGAELTRDAFLEWCRRGRLIEGPASDRPAAPVPPLDLREITSFDAEGLFLAMGLADAVMCLQKYLEIKRAPWDRGARVLDFGCGCGRVARYLSLLDSIECFATDVNPRLVEWCSKNIDHLQTVVCGADPPLRFGDATFELICAISVFTHLSQESAERWLGELARILRPGGLLLASTHGQASLVIRKTSSAHQSAGGLTDDAVDAILERLPVEGFIFRPYGADVLERAQAGSAYGTAFIEPGWLRSHATAAGLKIIEYVPAGLRGLQDLVIMSGPKAASI